MGKELVCSIELSKENGITVKVENAKGKITQTIHMDGTTLTTTVKGKDSTSTITQKVGQVLTKVKGKKETSTIDQKDQSVTVKVKNFTVDAETVTMKSKKDSKHTVGAKLTMTSKKDATIKSNAKMTVKSMKAMTLSTTDKLTAKAIKDILCKGKNAQLNGMAKAVVKGGMAATVDATKVDVKAKAQANVAGAITNVGKNLTTIKGQMVKVEGMMVKLG